MCNLFGTAQFRRPARPRRLPALLVFVVLLHPLFGQTGITTEDAGLQPAADLFPDVFCFSGSPLLLQVNAADPQGLLESISFDSDECSISYRIPNATDRDRLRFYINPFLTPGSYEADITLKYRNGIENHSRLDVGFVDFVWGRDNLSFGNNSEYISQIGTFGEVLAEWLNVRFGEMDEADVVLLVNFMYGLFGKNTGHCYAFAGTEVRYWRWPDLLPSFYDSTHDLRGRIAYYQREMTYLQYDIIFNHFLAGPGLEQIADAMSIQEIESQVALIESRIAAGEPVTVGFAGPDLHHSMLVFGFIRNHTTRTVDLLVANNWKNDEKLNIHSRDAEMIRLFLDPAHDGPVVRWHYDQGVRKFEIDRLFAVDISRDPYLHDHALLKTLTARLRNQLESERRAVVVVEEASGARLTDGERSTGWLGSLITGELEEVWFERAGESYRFTCPADSAYELELADAGGARVLSAVPMPETGMIVSAVQVTETAEGGQPVIRRIALPGLPAVTGQD